MRCNCFAEGKATEPPVPREHIRVDEDGYFDYCPKDNLSYEEYRKKYEAEDRAFTDWKESCCEHPDMEYCSEEVSNIGGLGFLRSAFNAMGSEKLPILTNMLPHGNGGMFPLEKVRGALKELLYFEEHIVEFDKVILLDEDAHEVVYSCLLGEEVTFIYALANCVSLSEYGVSIYDPETGERSFLSKYFAQRIEQDDDTSETVAVLYSFEGMDIGLTSVAIGQKESTCFFRVMRWCIDGSEFRPVIGRLRRLLEASAETGNPIVWC